MAGQRERVARGVSLVEVLVAIVVLSIGLMGTAGLLARSVGTASAAWQQSGVAAAITDMAERIRATPGAAAADFSFTETYEDQRTELDAGPLAVADDCEAASCTPAEAAAFHLTRWRMSVERTLPGSAVWVSPLSAAAGSAQATSYELAVLRFDKAMVDASGTLLAANQCTGAETGAAERQCCPAAADAPAGVRCVRLVVVP